MRTRVNQLLARVPRRSGGEGLFEVPRLEELVADPDKVRVLDAHTTRALRKQAIVALNVLFDHELVRDRLGMDRFGPRRDRLLNVEEAATKVRVTNRLALSSSQTFALHSAARRATSLFGTGN